MEIVKTGRAFLSLPSRWWSLSTLLALGFVFAVFAFKPGMVGLPPIPISSLQYSSSSSFGNRISTLCFPSSLDVQGAVSPQQEKALVPNSSTHSDSQYNPCMPDDHIKQSAQLSTYSQDADILEASPQRVHCSGNINNMVAYNSTRDNMSSSSTTTVKSFASSTADRHDRNHAPLQDLFPLIIPNVRKLAKCNLFTTRGKWIKDDRYPLYKPGTCPFVIDKFNCQQNGRPDTNYTRWRWAPRGCKLPRFSGKHMLQILRGKRLVFVGDSLNHNQWQSMLCMLRESLADRSRVVQQRRTNFAWEFLDYNCTVEFYSSLYLVDVKQGSEATNYIIRLDTMDKLETKWRKADVLVFNTGHWWGPNKIGNG